jgi:hypothetical protein
MGKTFSTGLLTNGIWQDSSNNIGIGASANASFKLQVTGATNLTGALSGTSASFTSGVTLATTSGVLAINTTGRPAGVGGGDNGKVWSKQATSGNYGIATIASATDSFTYIGHNGTDALLGTSYGTTGAYTDLVIQTADLTRFRLSGSTGAATFAAASGGAITLTTNGSANNWTSAITGNSTTSQSYGLLIQAGTNSTDAALRVRNQANSLDWLFVRGDGQVGIGTTSPLNLGSATNTVVTVNAATGNSAAYALTINNVEQAYISSQASSMAINNSANTPMIFATSNTERMRIAAGGLVTVTGTGAGNTSEGIFFKRTSNLAQGGYISGNGGALQIIATNEQNGLDGTTIFGRFNGTTVTESMTITAGGNVGIGTTPNSWASGTTALQIGTTGTLWNRASDGLFVLGSNSFFNGSADIQITTGTSNRIYFLNGGITFDRAVSTAAGSNTPWQTSMTITSGGCVAINNPSDKSQPLSVQGFIDNWTAFLQANTATSQSFGPLIYGGSNSNDWCIYAASAGGTPYFRVRGDGATFVAGSLSKGSGSFRIDHPLESMSETHELVHSFIEGPQADLIYRGKLTLVNGKAQANIDEVSTMTNGTFEALCREVQCFTTNESGWDLVKGKVIGNIIYIESQNVNSTDEISWMVIGERKDKHMIDTGWTDENGKVIVEPLKIDEPENLPNNNKQ